MGALFNRLFGLAFVITGRQKRSFCVTKLQENMLRYNAIMIQYMYRSKILVLVHMKKLFFRLAIALPIAAITSAFLPLSVQATRGESSNLLRNTWNSVVSIYNNLPSDAPSEFGKVRMPFTWFTDNRIDADMRYMLYDELVVRLLLLDLEEPFVYNSFEPEYCEEQIRPIVSKAMDGIILRCPNLLSVLGDRSIWESDAVEILTDLCTGRRHYTPLKTHWGRFILVPLRRLLNYYRCDVDDSKLREVQQEASQQPPLQTEDEVRALVDQTCAMFERMDTLRLRSGSFDDSIFTIWSMFAQIQEILQRGGVVALAPPLPPPKKASDWRDFLPSCSVQ
jgi:hypothetical protein